MADHHEKLTDNMPRLQVERWEHEIKRAYHNNGNKASMIEGNMDNIRFFLNTYCCLLDEKNRDEDAKTVDLVYEGLGYQWTVAAKILPDKDDEQQFEVQRIEYIESWEQLEEEREADR